MYATRTTTRVLMATGMFLALARSAPAQELDHRRATLTKQTHTVVHLDNMRKMLQQMDTTVQRSQQLAQETAARLHQMPTGGTAQHQGVMPQMNERLLALTEQLKGLTEQMRTMMTDESMMQDRAMQTDMELIQQQLGAVALDTEKTLKAVDRMVRRMGR